MLKRKIESILKNWKDAEGHKPLILKGCRQCGKTFSVRQFAQENYAHEIYLNFYENKSYASIFSGSLEVDHLTMLISALLGPEAIFEAGKTVLSLDESQECPEARTSLKFFNEDETYESRVKLNLKIVQNSLSKFIFNTQHKGKYFDNVTDEYLKLADIFIKENKDEL